MEKDKGADRESRTYNKIIYNPSQRPKLRTKSHIFDVVEITEKEAWLTTDNIFNLEKKIQGNMTFLGGETMDVEGVVIWKKGNDIGLKFENMISSGTLLKELRGLLSRE